MRLIRILLITATTLGALILLGLFIAGANIPVLEPKGLIGSKEKQLIITCTLLMLIVVVPVYIMAVAFAIRYRKNNTKAKHTPEWEHNTVAEMCWWGIPLVIIGILSVIIWKSSHELNPFKPLESDKKPITIQVVALQWKWLFIYPEEGIATVNWVQFPEKTPVNFQITADAPMNSFWIPALGGQIYAMPGMRAKLHLISDATGHFEGLSAHMSGTGFAGMRFSAVACSDREFNEWVSSVKRGGGYLEKTSYKALTKPTQYNKVTTYSRVESELFEHIIMQYMGSGKNEMAVHNMELEEALCLED